jgi:hypothetical protein
VEKDFAKLNQRLEKKHGMFKKEIFKEPIRRFRKNTTINLVQA